MHAVYPGTFNPFTPGHRDVIARARQLFDRVTVLVAVNDQKRPTESPEQRAAEIRRALPPTWTTVTAEVWPGLTAAFCQAHQADVIIRGVRNRTDLTHEYQLAAMNESQGIPTLLLPTRPALAATTSTAA